MTDMSETMIFQETDDDNDMLAAYHFSPASVFLRVTSGAEDDGASAAVRLTQGSVERLRDALNEWLGDDHKPELPELLGLSVIDPVRQESLDRALSLHGPGAVVDRVLSSAALIEAYLRGPQDKPVRPIPDEPVSWLCSECEHIHYRGTDVCGANTSKLSIARCRCRLTWQS